MSTGLKNDGSRTYALLRPIQAGSGNTIEAITFRAVTLDHQNRWNRGAFPGPMSLMSELCGVTALDLGFVTFPDASLMMEEFIHHLPPAMREDIARGIVPEPQTPDGYDARDYADPGPDWSADRPPNPGEFDPWARAPRDARDKGPGFGGPPIEQGPGDARHSVPSAPGADAHKAYDDGGAGIDFGEGM